MSRIRVAAQWLDRVANGEWAIIPGSEKAASELADALHQLLRAHEADRPSDFDRIARLDARTQAQINGLIGAFNGVIRSNSQQIYVMYVHEKGAYSASALIEGARIHLSDDAQNNISNSEKTDFDLAGKCYVHDLATATGFHAMRALEAEARRYHKEVTQQSVEVDWTLNPLINGNCGRGQVGLRDAWKSEGAREDSPLLLIITLLTSISQIYRNPIMHPEMVLDESSSKQVFDTTALAISAMVADRLKREKTRAQTHGKVI